jgi:hypothetical protein
LFFLVGCNGCGYDGADLVEALIISTVLCTGPFPLFLMVFYRIQTKPFRPQYNILNPSEKLIMNSLELLPHFSQTHSSITGGLPKISSSGFKRRFPGFHQLNEFLRQSSRRFIDAAPAESLPDKIYFP